jgi:hypothetical protein
MQMFTKKVDGARADSLVTTIRNLWNKGPAHQIWLGLAGALLFGAMLGLMLGQFREAAELILTVIAMVVIML